MALDTDRITAAALNVDDLDASVWHEVAPAFTCQEAEALAELLRAAGCDTAADDLITGHRAADELGDLHFAAGLGTSASDHGASR